LRLGDEVEYHYPYRSIRDFRRALLGGDVVRAEAILRQVARELHEHAPPLVFARRIYAGFLTVAMNVLGESTDGDRSSDRESGHGIGIFPESADTLEELIDGIHRLAEEADTMVLSERDSGSDTALRLLEHIDIHFDDPGLSLQSLADKFELNPSYVSTLFKKHGQRNLSDYVWSLRVERAKEMLREGASTIGEVVQAVGYMDASSFIRRFRRSEGITPGEYRLRNKKKQLDSTFRMR